MTDRTWDDAPRTASVGIAAYNERAREPVEAFGRRFTLRRVADRPPRSFIDPPGLSEVTVREMRAAGVRIRRIAGGRDVIVNLAGAEFDGRGWSQFETDPPDQPLTDGSGRELDGITVASHADGKGEHLSMEKADGTSIRIGPDDLARLLDELGLLRAGDASPINLVGCGIAGPFAERLADVTGRTVRSSFLNVNMVHGVMTPRMVTEEGWVLAPSVSDPWVVTEPGSGRNQVRDRARGNGSDSRGI